jgi:hypothetical protein
MKFRSTALTAAALILTSAPAHADNIGDQSLASLSRDGFNMAPDQAIPYARQICYAEDLRASASKPYRG